MSTKVMYLILRSDLSSKLKWPLGAVFTQIAHASTACIWTFREDQEVIGYMTDMDHMHKVTLKVDSEERLLAEVKRLEDAKIDHKVWHEDHMAVCVALKPQSRDVLKPLLNHLPLYR